MCLGNVNEGSQHFSLLTDLKWLLSGMASYRSKTMQQQSPLSLSAALCADGWKAG